MSVGRFAWLRATLLRLRPNDNSNNYVELRPPSGQSSNVAITLLGSLPTSGTEALTIDASGNMGRQAIGGGGSVTNFSAVPSAVFSVASSNTTPALSLNSQNGGLFLASPTSANGVPGFRAIAWSDVSSLAGVSSTSFAIGNDSRFHTQNTDVGTTAVSFQLDSGNNGSRIKNASGAIQVRNAADSANADLVAANLTLSGNLTVQGTTTTIDSNTLAIGDNHITLNNDVIAGTPTENAGIEVRRGSQATVTIVQWDESVDDTFVTVGSTLRRVGISLEQTFTNADLVSSVFTWTHNLGRQYFAIAVVDNLNRTIGAEITFTSATQCTVDLTGFGAITGTWRVIGG